MRRIGRLIVHGLVWLLMNGLGNLFGDGPLANRVIRRLEATIPQLLRPVVGTSAHIGRSRQLRFLADVITKLLVLAGVAGPVVLGTPTGKAGPTGSLVYAGWLVAGSFAFSGRGGFTFTRVLVVALVIDISIPIAIVVYNVAPWFNQRLFLWFSLGLTTGISKAGLALSLRNILSAIWAAVRVVLPLLVLTSLGLVVLWLVHKPSSKQVLDELANLSTLITIIIAAVTGIVIGHRLIRPGVIELIKVQPYLRAMQWPVIGFILGYLVIVVWFAGMYSAIFHAHPAQTFIADSKTSPPPSWGNFLYLSFMTISTLGYGGLQPTSAVLRTLASVEVMVGIGWTVVVFAAILAYLGPRFETIAARSKPGESEAASNVTRPRSR